MGNLPSFLECHARLAKAINITYQLLENPSSPTQELRTLLNRVAECAPSWEPETLVVIHCIRELALPDFEPDKQFYKRLLQALRQLSVKL